ncbi:hypothetical protein BaRGS_00027794, partial [Batillaria attramentaria]
MADRKAELERKKARLEQMRRERKEKELSKKGKEGDESKGGKSADTSSIDPDALLGELGISPASDTSSSVSPVRASPLSQSTQETETPAAVSQTTPRKVRLSVAKVNETSIPPRENVAYSKETQTIAAEPLDKDGSPRFSGYGFSGTRFASHELEWDDEFDFEDEAPPEMSEEEKKQILMSEEFMKFFGKTSRIIERALAEEVDIFVDYAGNDGKGKDDEAMAGERLKLNRDFYDDRWSKHRIITSLDWSSQHPELLLSSYSANEDATNEPDGVALIWNIKFKKDTPEFVFHCQ